MNEFDAVRDLGLIEQLASGLGPSPEGLPCAQLAAYVGQVASWNRKINLTAAREARDMVEVLCADAFVLADERCVPHGARLVDVGSGAGAPVVPLLLLRSDLNAVCVEPQRKRAAFLRLLSARLGLLGRLRVREARLELGLGRGPGWGERFDAACSRATFAPAQWLRAGLGLAPRVLVLLAGGEPPPGPEAAELVFERAYRLPFSGAERRVAVFTSATPATAS